MSSGALHASYFADVSIYDDASGSYLGVVENGSASIEYAEDLSLNIMSTIDFDWIRLTPDNYECGRNRQYQRGEPVEMVISPGSEDSQCQFTIEAMKRPGRVVDSMAVLVSFDGTSNSGGGGGGTTPAPDPDPTPDPDPSDNGGGGNKVISMKSGRIDFTQGTSGSRDYKVGNVVGRSAHGNRIYCVVSHLSYDDPIIYPGLSGAAHLHMFWGNSNTDAYSTPETLPFSGNSSCEGGSNYRAGLWIPALYSTKGEVTVPDETFIYYKKFGSKSLNFNHLQVVPQGLEMLASNSTQNFTKKMLKAERITKDGRRVLRLDLSFPSCVATHDGTRTGRPILSYKDMPGQLSKVVNSHVSYPGGPNKNSVDCPASHPYGFPVPAAILVFDEATVGNDPYLASDMMSNAPNMSTLHADYVFGMDDTVSKQMLKCTIEARDCRFDTSGGNLSDRWYSKDGEQVYQFNKLAPGFDKTPFGKSLKAMNM
ncbi:DUF1996 domain-containing protein [Halioxenophilus aromaticivorans]|uniref:DUF1996 domain-containing protein n=1 Tax=Halioxenophilus aromaticivorans TaxID=1306992 RepID=UPI0031E946A8